MQYVHEKYIVPALKFNTDALLHGAVAAYAIAVRCEDLVAEERTRPMRDERIYCCA